MNKIILALNKMLNEFDYSVKTKQDKKRYRLKTPFEFLKSKSGVCWEYADYVAHTIPKSEFYFICDQEINNTYTFVIYPEKGKWYWFESSWKSRAGIYEYSSKKECLNDVTKKFLDNLETPAKSWCLLTKPNYTNGYIPYGKDAVQYIKWVILNFEFADGDKDLHEDLKKYARVKIDN